MKYSRASLVAFTSLILLAACGGPGGGRGHGPGPGGMGGGPSEDAGQFVKTGALLFVGFDKNNDYRISSQEFSAGLDTAFANADSDRSGTLSLFEYQNWAGRALGSTTALPNWMTLDRNGDSSISRAEFFGAYQQLANDYGLSSPGGLTFSALTIDMAEMMAGGGGKEGGGGEGGPGGGPGGGRGGPPPQ